MTPIATRVARAGHGEHLYFAHSMDRFLAWTRWFSDNGHSRDQPIANYYAWFFGAVDVQEP